MVNYPAKQFSAFRILFGSYLALWFFSLIPLGPSLFGRQGLMGDHFFTPFPNVFKLMGSPGQVRCVLVLSGVLSLSYAAGFFRRTASLALWFMWASLCDRLLYLEIPSQGYIGWLLLASLLIPTGEPFAVAARPDPAWKMPSGVTVGAWILLCLGYTISGIAKCNSPSWIRGDALSLIYSGVLARPVWSHFMSRGFALVPLKAATWFTLGLETLYAPLSLWRVSRKWAWFAMMAVHVAVLASLQIGMVSLGMILVHFFVMDVGWF